MRVDTESRPVSLRESPQNVLGRLVDIGAAWSESKSACANSAAELDVPVYSGKYRSKGVFESFILNTSILFRNKMTDVRRNHRELITDSNRISDSCIRF
jgi:hypothetical protein